MRIGIDDVGAGSASLACLKRFPAGTVKIDREFVAGLSDAEGDAAIVLALVALGQSLGMRGVAEGVETPRQLDFLRAAGCDEAQGYLLGCPAGPEALAGQLRTLT